MSPSASVPDELPPEVPGVEVDEPVLVPVVPTPPLSPPTAGASSPQLLQDKASVMRAGESRTPEGWHDHRVGSPASASTLVLAMTSGYCGRLRQPRRRRPLLLVRIGHRRALFDPKLASRKWALNDRVQAPFQSDRPRTFSRARFGSLGRPQAEETWRGFPAMRRWLRARPQAPGQRQSQPGRRCFAGLQSRASASLHAG